MEEAELISVVKHALSSKPQGLSTLLGQGEANLMKHALGAFFFLLKIFKSFNLPT